MLNSSESSNSNTGHIPVNCSSEEKKVRPRKKKVTLIAKYQNDVVNSSELYLFVTGFKVLTLRNSRDFADTAFVRIRSGEY